MTWPYHLGELEAQVRAGGGARGGAIRSQMPDQHRAFFQAAPWVVVGGVGDGWPVATVWSGTPGFIAAPDPETLEITVERPVDATVRDPAERAFTVGAPIGMLGIELATRRRNRANGFVAAADEHRVVVAVGQSFGNCPQYILPREVRRAEPSAASAERLTRLDADAAAAITAADTFFVATSARTDEDTGGVDVSHRGGPPGFVRIAGDALTIPDYPGNRYFNTLGNLVAEPRAALLFIDFARGDVLHLQGRTEIQWDGPEVRALDGAERLWRVHIEAGWRRPGGLALRWTEVPGAARLRRAG